MQETRQGYVRATPVLGLSRGAWLGGVPGFRVSDWARLRFGLRVGLRSRLRDNGGTTC